MTKCKYQSGDEVYHNKKIANARIDILRKDIKRSWKSGDGINLRLKLIKCPNKYIVRTMSRGLRKK